MEKHFSFMGYTLLVTAIVFTAGLTQSAAKSGDEIKTVRLLNGDGDITVEGYDGSMVKWKSGEISGLTYKSTGSVCSVKICDDKNISLLVPRSADVDVEAPDGDIFISNIEGDVTAESEDGDISFTGIAGSVSAKSEDGSIDVRFSEKADIEKLYLKSEDGDIVATLPADYGATLKIRVFDGKLESGFKMRTVGTGSLTNNGRDAFKATVKIGNGSGRGEIVVEDGNLTINSH